MIRFLLSRIGFMMLMVGIFVLVLGVAAESSGQPAFNLLMIGMAMSFFGFLLWNRLRPKKHRNTRFSIFRKRDRHEERDENDGWDNRYDD